MPKRVKSKIKRRSELSFFGALGTVIRKNIKLILRSKSSSLIVVLGPLLIIALIGTAYNTSNIYDIRIGSYSPSYSELAESLLDDLGSKQFSVIRFDSSEECVTSLKSAEIHICVLFPANLESGGTEAIEFNVDQSRVNLVWIIIDALNTKIGAKTEELSLELTGSLLTVLTNTGTTLDEKAVVLQQLQSQQGELQGNLDDLSTLVGGIDVDISDYIGVSNIGQALDEDIAAQNLSSSDFPSTKSYILYVINRTNVLEEQFYSLSSDAQGKLDTLDTGFKSTSSSFSDVVSSLESIQSSISGVTGQSAESIVSPLTTKITPVVSEKTHLSFLFPTLIVLVIMLIALVLSSGLIVREKTSPAFFRNFMTPVGDGVFIFGHFLTNFVILFLQIGIVLAVAGFFFKGALGAVIGNVLLALVFIIPVFIFLGLFIGYLFKSQETSLLATICVGSILLFFSSAILPLETLPVALKKIAEYNPFVVSELLLKKIMLFKLEIMQLGEPLMLLLGYIIVLVLVVVGVHKYSKLKVE